jgi:hypothetical protein
MRSTRAKLLIASIAFLSLAVQAQGAPFNKEVQQACAADYRAYCADYGLETSALRTCMDRVGNSLSKACVHALIRAGEVSQAEVDRRKNSGR